MTTRPAERTLKLRLIGELHSAEAGHAPDTPFREAVAFETRVDHDHYFRRDLAFKRPYAFERKDIRVEIHSSINPEFLQAAEQEYGIPNACGTINFIVADNDPAFEFIDVDLAVPGETFSKLWRHALLAAEGRFLTRIDLTLAGSSLPEPSGKPLLAGMFGSVDLADLPIAKQTHIIRDFSLSHTSKAVLERNRKRAETLYT